MQENKGNWGGKRDNAGRKTVANKKITISICLNPETVEKIDRERNNLSRSKFIEQLINDAF